MINLMNGLSNNGLNVDLLLHTSDTPDLGCLNEEIRVIDTKKKGFSKDVKGLKNYLEKEQPTVLLANKEKAGCVAVTSRKNSHASTRIVIRIGTATSESLNRRPLIKRWWRLRRILYTCRNADAVIAVSTWVARDLAALTDIPQEKIYIVNNPTVGSSLVKKAREPVDHPWLAPGSPPVIIAVGRLARPKDFATLIKAFARVRAIKECRLIILGEGKKRASLSRLAEALGVQKDIDLPGFVSNPFSYMNKASLFVLSSVWEGSPNVLIEALALGLPVVSTDCKSGPREILKNGKYGPLVPVGNPQSLAKAMHNMLEQPLEKEFLQLGAEPYGADKNVLAYMAAMGLKGSHQRS